ncbi:ParA family protein [Pseudomonas sp. HUK17]|uniref:ParA family protein n=1 Tax=Pseudomonas sp. HUK17 TaxID=1799359 RepID=UPI0009E6C3CF|nr:AAA family ATPase [Pseudomonas sp. HUK17]
MDVIAVINYKGGVGKTTVTSNLAAELALRGKKVLLLDTDAQASLTFSFVKPDFWDENYKDSLTIKSWFDAISEGKEPPPLNEFIITPTEVNRQLKKSKSNGSIDLICSHLGLINVDLELATLLGGANMQQSKSNYIKVHAKLRDAITVLQSESDYDILLIDCPPNFNIVTKNAIIASQQILIPAKPDYLSTLGIDYLRQSVTQLASEFNDYAGIDSNIRKISPEILGVVFTMIQITSSQPISAQRQYIAQTKRSGIPTYENYFRENKTMFSSAPESLVPAVLQYHAGGTYADIVSELEDFVEEFEGKLQGIAK